MGLRWKPILGIAFLICLFLFHPPTPKPTQTKLLLVAQPPPANLAARNSTTSVSVGATKAQDPAPTPLPSASAARASPSNGPHVAPSLSPRQPDSTAPSTAASPSSRALPNDKKKSNTNNPSSPPFVPLALRPPVSPVPLPSSLYKPKPQPLSLPEADQPLVTIFLTPFRVDRSTPKGLIQINTISALAILPGVTVVLFAEDNSVDDIAAAFDLTVLRSFATNKFGTPVLRDLFLRVLDISTTPFVGYMNGDILVAEDFTHTLSAVLMAIRQGVMNPSVLVVGRRFNVEAENLEKRNLVLSPGDTVQDVDRVRRGLFGKHKPRPFMDVAEDYFVVSRGAFNWTEIPAFVIGRPGYDNWLVDFAVHSGVETVDASHTILATHQTGKDGNKAGHRETPDKLYNIEMMNDHKDHGKTSKCRFNTEWYTGQVNPGSALTINTGALSDGTDAIVELHVRFDAGSFVLPADKLRSFNRIDCKRHHKWWPCQLPSPSPAAV